MKLSLSKKSPSLIEIRPVVCQFLSQEIRLLRKKQGLTGRELATILHISQQQVSRYERGCNLIPLDMLLLILSVLDEPAERFFYRVCLFIEQQTGTHYSEESLLPFL